MMHLSAFRQTIRAFGSGSKKSLSSQVFRNRQIRLASRPVGLPTAANFSITEEDVSLPRGEPSMVVKTTYLSLDPAMRGWMREGRSYIAPVGINEVMRATGTGEVVASSSSVFKVGDIISGMVNAQEYSVFSDTKSRNTGLWKINTDIGTELQWLSAMGMPGMTAYFGLMEIGKPVRGQTLVVSSAAGAVGQIVGQLGKIKGMKVVGIAGGAEKCAFVCKEFGFDSCIDYKQPLKSFYSDFKKHCPKGVDIYFDNVGGEILDCVLTRLNYQARIIICGAISQYNAEGGNTPGPKNYLSLLVNRARMEGLVVFDYSKQYPVAIAEISQWLAAGKMKVLTDVVTGPIDKFPDTLNMLFSGQNNGKLLLKIESKK
jgi:NADPH-dependent curcumin reductase CurA